MSLRKALSLGVLQSASSLVFGFFSIKVTSVYLGAAGVGTLGQLTYFTSLTFGALTAGLNIGLVRRTAELANEHVSRVVAISTVLRLILALGILTSLVIAFNARWLAQVVLQDESLALPFIVFSAVLIFGLIGSVMVACAMGASDFRASTGTNIGAAGGSFLLIVLLCPSFGLLGGLIALACLPIVSSFVTWLFARKSKWWPNRPFSYGFSGLEARTAMSYVPMAMINTIGTPILQLLIRGSIASQSGLAAVGLLHGVMRLSDMYMGIVTSLFIMYFFPRFSKVRLAEELTREIRKGLLIVVPAVALVSALIYLTRDLIVQIVFTREFLPMRELFGWQMIGNTLKLTGELLSYVLLSKIHAHWMAALALATMFVWWTLAMHLIPANGVVGATQAYAAVYGLYCLATAAGVWIVLRRMRAGR